MIILCRLELLVTCNFIMNMEIDHILIIAIIIYIYSLMNLRHLDFLDLRLVFLKKICTEQGHQTQQNAQWIQSLQSTYMLSYFQVSILPLLLL